MKNVLWVGSALCLVLGLVNLVFAVLGFADGEVLQGLFNLVVGVFSLFVASNTYETIRS